MDDELRELERRWRRSGEPGDQARWLQARLRAGELRAPRLKLAAALGHAGAGLASPGAATPLSALGEQLGACSAEALTRALAAVAASTIELPDAVTAVRDGRARAEVQAAVQALAAAERWIVCPCAAHAAAADALAERGSWADADSPARAVARYAGRGLPFPDGPDRSMSARGAGEELTLAARRLTEQRVRAAVAGEVGDWLLGVRDAVAARAALWASLPPLPLPTPRALPPAPETPPPPTGGGGRVDGTEASDGS